MLLCAMGNAGYGMIARLYGVGEVAVCKWIGKAAVALPEPATPAEVEIVQRDEMWHAVDGKKNECRLWRAFAPLEGRAFAPVRRRTPDATGGAWVPGQRDDPTCQQLLEKIGTGGRVFLTDDREGYQRCVPAAQLFTGKYSSFGIAQDNRTIWHHLARFRRRSQVNSRSRQMVDLSLRLLHHLREPANFLRYQQVALSIFGQMSPIRLRNPLDRSVPRSDPRHAATPSTLILMVASFSSRSTR